MKNILLLIMISVILYGGIKKEDNFDYLDKESTSEIAKFLRNEMIQQLPIKIDKVTTVTRFLSFKNSVTYIKVVDTNNKLLQNIILKHDSKMHHQMFKNDTEVICNIPLFKYLIGKRDMYVGYTYLNKQKKLLFEHTVEKEDCKKAIPNF